MTLCRSTKYASVLLITKQHDSLYCVRTSFGVSILVTEHALSLSRSLSHLSSKNTYGILLVGLVGVLSHLQCLSSTHLLCRVRGGIVGICRAGTCQISDFFIAIERTTDLKSVAKNAERVIRIL